MDRFLSIKSESASMLQIVAKLLLSLIYTCCMIRERHKIFQRIVLHYITKFFFRKNYCQIEI